jgi:hypothetical protein
MEEKIAPSSKGALGYGLFIGVAIIVYALILFLADLDANRYLNWVSYVILAAGLYLSVLNFRNKYQDGYIKYGKAMGVSFMVLLVTSIIVAIYTYFYFEMINPGIYEEQLMIAEEQLIERGMSDVEIDQAMKMSEMFQNPWISASFALVGNLIVGMIIALITSIFVKRDYPAGVQS